MPSPAFIIEGHIEKRILQSICRGFPIRRIGCNGEDVSMSVMAKFIDTHIRLFNNRHYPIVIIFDRELRQASCNALIRELTSELNDRGHGGQFVVGIPDRTIENWILADRQMLVDSYNANVNNASYEGSVGKSEIKKMLGADYKYHETTLGVELFLKCNPKVIYKRSPSFRSLVKKLPYRCPWISIV